VAGPFYLSLLQTGFQPNFNEGLFKITLGKGLFKKCRDAKLL
ncbi:MAG: hypothetical protein ACD_39C01318G0001, partial [uncultured bacterium]